VLHGIIGRVRSDFHGATSPFLMPFLMITDMQVLCKSLTYRQGRPKMLTGEPISRGICLYQPPFEEFQVLRVNVDVPGTIGIPAQKSPMILLGLETSGRHSLQVGSRFAASRHPCPFICWARSMSACQAMPGYLVVCCTGHAVPER
jgi:hypothetical protein